MVLFAVQLASVENLHDLKILFAETILVHTLNLQKQKRLHVLVKHQSQQVSLYGQNVILPMNILVPVHKPVMKDILAVIAELFLITDHAVLLADG